MLRSANSVSEAQELIRPLIGMPITNDKLGSTAILYKGSVKKMGSSVATQKSISPELHAKAVANVDILYKNAMLTTTHPDGKGQPEIKQVHRIGNLMLDEKNEQYVPVMITVLEYKDGIKNHINEKLVDNIYSVEVIKVSEENEVRRAPTDGLLEENPHVPIADFIKKLQNILATANPKTPSPYKITYFPENVNT